MIRVFENIAGKIRGVLEDTHCRKIAANYNFNGYKRIYLTHIRKTAGTSLNRMFLSLSGEDPAALYTQLASAQGHRIRRNGLIYVGWNVSRINQGDYFYGFSHAPLHQLDLPAGTFTVACFRDPVDRVISHFNMLTYFQVSGINHPCMETEGKWIGDGFDSFLERIPKDHLLNQLYMFSPGFEVCEAVRNIRKLSHYFFVEDFEDGIEGLNTKAGLGLRPVHLRKAASHTAISNKSQRKLRELLIDEYDLLDRIRCH